MTTAQHQRLAVIVMAILLWIQACIFALELGARDPDPLTQHVVVFDWAMRAYRGYDVVFFPTATPTPET